MLMSEFDARRLGDDIRKLVDKSPRGFANQVIRETGISHASFYRLMDGTNPVHNVNLLLSVCKYCGLQFENYIADRKPKSTGKGALIEFELIRTEYVRRVFDKGWHDRDFNIGGRWYKWFGNVPTPMGLVRVGVLDESR